MIKVILKEAGKDAVIREIEPSLSFYRSFVGGDIEYTTLAVGKVDYHKLAMCAHVFSLSEEEILEDPFLIQKVKRNVGIYYNAIGKIMDLKHNIVFNKYDFIAGNIVIFSCESNSGIEESLSNEEIEDVLKYLKENSI